MLNAAFMSQRWGLGHCVGRFGKQDRALVEILQTLVLQLAILVEHEELHHHNGRLPQRERLVKRDGAYVPPAALGVALGEIGAGVKPGQGGRCLG